MLQKSRSSPPVARLGGNRPAHGPLESLAALKATLSEVAPPRDGWDDSSAPSGGRVVANAAKAAVPSTQSLARAYVMKGVARPGASPQTTVKSNRARQKQPSLPGKRARVLPAVPLSTAGGAGDAAGGGEAAAPPAAEAAKKRYLLPRKRWAELPDWISLPSERGRALPRLEVDPLFEAGPPCLLPFQPPAGAPTRRGAVVVCPGGNYEFLHPREGPPIGAWVAEAMGVPSFVLRYRLLPAAGLEEMLADLGGARGMLTGRRRLGSAAPRGSGLLGLALQPPCSGQAVSARSAPLRSYASGVWLQCGRAARPHSLTLQLPTPGAVREARRHANGGLVVAVGFSAGGHLVASSVALSGEVYVYLSWPWARRGRCLTPSTPHPPRPTTTTFTPS